MHAWYLAVYVDAVEWVELPNTLSMSQFADGGVMGPYIATGKYIQRMSPHCRVPLRSRTAQRRQRVPVHHLVWDFLMRHERSWSGLTHALQSKNVRV